MSDRVRIALRVWLVTILFAAAGILAVTVGLFMGADFMGNEGPLSYLNITVWPFLAAFAAVKTNSGYASRASAGAIHAGGIILGIAAGLFIGFGLTWGFGLAGLPGIIMTMVIGPVLGAMLGTLIPIRVHPLAAGVFIVALVWLMVYLAGGFQ